MVRQEQRANEKKTIIIIAFIQAEPRNLRNWGVIYSKFASSIVAHAGEKSGHGDTMQMRFQISNGLYLSTDR